MERRRLIPYPLYLGAILAVRLQWAVSLQAKIEREPFASSAVGEISKINACRVIPVARLGRRVVAVEPTRELRQEGQRIHSSLPIEWLDDELPYLVGMRSRQEQFDLICF